MIKEILEFCGEYRAKNIKNLMGREGTGWQATILRNGKEICTASDVANGGPVNIYWTNPCEEIFLNTYAESKSTDKFEMTEGFLDEVVNYEILLKKIKSNAKKYLLVEDTSKEKLDPNGISMSYSMYKVADTPENRQFIINKDPEVIFLNDSISLIDIKKPKSLKLK